MIPIALVSLLLCVCFCGPKDSRGQIPEKMMGIRLSQKRKISDNNFVKPKITITSNNSDEELEYKDGYVQRKDSKKTRFATDIKFIEPIRRSSSVSCLENFNSRRNSCISNDSIESNQFQGLKKTRFSDSVSVLGENSETIPTQNQPKRKIGIIQRSISVA
uniref:Uncharacterized protein n=1 Tax=Panagrolaimus sp. JU765 TaxID=591449 RepID=A0AC34Q2X1_9BILA